MNADSLKRLQWIFLVSLFWPLFGILILFLNVLSTGISLPMLIALTSVRGEFEFFLEAVAETTSSEWGIILAGVSPAISGIVPLPFVRLPVSNPRIVHFVGRPLSSVSQGRLLVGLVGIAATSSAPRLTRS